MMLAALLDSALRALVLGIAIWIIVRCLRVSLLRVEVIVWRSVLLAALAMPLLTALLHAFTPAATIEPAVALGIEVAATEGGFVWSTAVLMIYFIVATLFVLRQVHGLVRGYAVARHSIRPDAPWAAGVDVRLSDEVAAPATFASTILLPYAATEWSTAQLDAVLAHERTHIRNRDFWFQLLAKTYRALFWFSPLAWWLPRHLAKTAEHLCDDAAVRAIRDRAAYATLLLEFARTPQRLHGAVGMAQGIIAERIERILDSAQSIAALRPLHRALIIVVLVPLITAAASLSVVRFDRLTTPRSDRLLPLSHPAYPAAARRLNEQGTVVLDLHVLGDGSVADVRVRKSSGYSSLDESAASEARRWRLVPGTVNDSPAPSWGTFAVTFKLAD